MPLTTKFSGLLKKLALSAAAAGMVAVLAAPTAHGQPAAADTVSREYLIKAALLYNFAKFAEWPAAAFADDTDALRICIIGDNPFGRALESINGKTVRERTLSAGSIARVEDAAACHILFVSGSESDRLASILDAVGDLPILTVADMGQFATAGGIVALKNDNNQSRLEINIGAAEKAGVSLSSKLLRLADTVGTQTAQVPATAQ